MARRSLFKFFAGFGIAAIVTFALITIASYLYLAFTLYGPVTHYLISQSIPSIISIILYIIFFLIILIPAAAMIIGSIAGLIIGLIVGFIISGTR
ncbi:MAG: hypothetical protein ABR981_00540 [Candidatus Micrarchaeaceae archaeon]|jgi:hypothetical protein